MRHLAAALLAACAADPAPADPADSAGPGPGVAEARALFVGIDGLRPDGLTAADTPHLDRLFAEGARSLTARTQQTGATSSGPGWTSIFTGVEVARHGVEANGDYAAYDRSLPTFARVVRQELGRPTAAAAHWPEILSAIHGSEAFDDQLLTDDDGVAAWLARDVATGGAHLLVAHLDDVDAAGHATGFSADNPDYLAAIEAQDRRLGELLAAIDARPAAEGWLVVVTTDHGGAGTDHGPQDAANQTIPFVAWGPGVAPGDLGAEASHLDAFPTVLTWLGATPAQLGEAAGAARTSAP